MEYSVPRIMIAGSGSGCGKTTVTCAVLKALSDNGLRTGAFKCGPDYIDPMYHSRILGAPSTNLDSFFFTENTLNWLLVKNSSGKEINIIEGVMGFYDGLGIDSAKASSYEIAQITHTPVILVLNAKGAALSLLASLQGFLSFMPENQICGVILNRCSAMTYERLAEMIREHFSGKIIPFGYLPVMAENSFESRHLGLITAQEAEDFDQKVSQLAAQAERSIDLEGIIETAREAQVISCSPVPVPRFSTGVRIAAAQDKAFCFYYHDNLDFLQEAGAEIIPFSPMTDRSLPEGIHGLWLGGGYPELYARELSANVPLRESVRTALTTDRLPCIAECGGFMYLTEAIDGFPMAGVLPGESFDQKKLTRFGYVHLKAEKDNMLCRAGEAIAAHEFHYWDSTDTGSDFTARKPSGKQWKCIFANNHLYAGFPHFHFYAKPMFGLNFYKACLNYKEKTHA